MDRGFWEGGDFDKCVIYGRGADNSTDDKDVTRTLGTHFIACGWSPDTCL